MNEQLFKHHFIVQFLAAYAATNYNDFCVRGWKGYSPPIEDAEYLADLNWREFQEKGEAK